MTTAAPTKPRAIAGTEPPHSAEVERAVLAVVLDGRHADAWGRVRERCAGAAAFFVRNHRLVALVIERLHDDAQPIDAQAVAEAAKRMRFGDAIDALAKLDGDPKARVRRDEAESYEDSLLAGIGGYAWLGELACAYGHATALERNADLADDYHRRRRALAAIATASDDLRRGAPAAGVVADDLAGRLGEVFGQGVVSQTLGDCADQVLAEHDAAATTGTVRVTGAWGYPGLDDVLPLKAGRAICLAGDPGGGKSSLALQAAIATARKLGPESVAIVPFEQPGKELTTILIARAIGADTTAVENGWLSPEQRIAADAVRDELKRLRPFVRDMGQKGDNRVSSVMAWLRGRRNRAGGKLHLVIVDHVALFHAGRAGETEYQRITEASGQLKALAMSGVCVLMVSQLSRDGRKETRNSAGLVELPPEPRLADLRGSGALEQDSDAVLFLWRRSDKKRPVRAVDLLCPKNRGGADFLLHADFHAAQGQVFVPRREQPPPDDPDRRIEAAHRAEKREAEPSDAEDLFANATTRNA